jgi:DNA recombination protein RmuC
MSLLYFALGALTGIILMVLGFRKKFFEAERLKIEVETLTRAREEQSQAYKAAIESQKEQFKELQQTSQHQFEVLAQKIFEEKSRSFQESNQSHISQILVPFREQIVKFEKVIADKFATETQERFMLKGEIDRLIQMHEKLANEAGTLSKALRGDNKFQGDWGELVLERVLESSGLRPGEEYLIQATFQTDQGDCVRPDVVIKLPENRHIVIDSKVSLKSFEAYQNCDSDELRPTLLTEHLRSLEAHIMGLSQRGYDKLPDLGSPDFVFLFIPIEPAWLLALKERPDLGSWAWDRGVAVVTASTLFTSLRTVSNLWRLDRQNKNAEQIAKEAGALYDKFVGFLEEYDKIGTQIQALQNSYDTAKGRLASGKGNVISKIENLRLMGAKSSKQIKSNWLETDGLPDSKD